MSNPETVTPMTQRGQLAKDDAGASVAWDYTNITAQTDTIVKATPGVLHSITFNKPVATAVVTLYNNTTATGGAVIGTITTPANPQPVTLTYDVEFTTGLSITTATASQDITISWI